MKKPAEVQNKPLAVDLRKKQEENEEKIKRFDDIFRMLLLTVTIMITFGSNSFGKVDIWLSFMYVLIALGFWMVGHAFGANPRMRRFELWQKLVAWAYASFVLMIILVKYSFGLSALDALAVSICGLMAFCLTILPYLWLRSGLSNEGKSDFLPSIGIIFLLIILGLGIIGGTL